MPHIPEPAPFPYVPAPTLENGTTPEPAPLPYVPASPLENGVPPDGYWPPVPKKDPPVPPLYGTLPPPAVMVAVTVHVVVAKVKYTFKYRNCHKNTKM